MKLIFVPFLSLVLYSSSIFSMGGDKPGPNGGFISMPGTYHVELIDKGQVFRVYLLDIGMKNPTVENSNVTLKFTSTNSQEIICKPEHNYFVCKKPIGKLQNFKDVVVESTRNKVHANIATYKLPLKFEKN